MIKKASKLKKMNGADTVDAAGIVDAASGATYPLPPAPQRSAPDAHSAADQRTEAFCPFLLHVDYWDDAGVRHMAGETVNMPVSRAVDYQRKGIGECADPLPGMAARAPGRDSEAV